MGKSKVVLAFDVGERRIGVAKATAPPRIAQPLTTLSHDDSLQDELEKLIENEKPAMLVVGWPRNQRGEATAQSRQTQDWVRHYLVQWKIPLYWQDESLTSVAAQAHLQAKGHRHTKADIDALAASIILTDFLETKRSGVAI